jgi:hypothetical protein
MVQLEDADLPSIYTNCGPGLEVCVWITKSLGINVFLPEHLSILGLFLLDRKQAS